MLSPTGYTDSRSTPLSGNDLINSLLHGTQWSGNWAGVDLTYSFIVPGWSYFKADYSPDNEYLASYALTAAQQTAAISAMAAWSQVADITFWKTVDNKYIVGDLRFGGYSAMPDDVAAWAYMPGDFAAGGDIWIGPQTNALNPTKGSYDYLTFVHEIGHALGLKHPFDEGLDNTTLLPAELDDVRYTVMSYNNLYTFQPTGPMVLDIAAIQYIYGANRFWKTGNDTYKWAPGQSVFETIWDAGGLDTLDASNQAAGVVLNLNQGEFSKIGKVFDRYDEASDQWLEFNEGLGIAYGAKIENAIGSAFADTLIGNELVNVLNGGLGNDTYVVGMKDVIVETSTLISEIDSVESSVSWALGANLENLTLTGSAALNGTGNALANRITGNSGDNLLNGGAGLDTLIGGAGNDTYVLDRAEELDLLEEVIGQGNDTLRIAYTTGNRIVDLNQSNLQHVENVVLAAAGAFTLIGNASDNQLTGGALVDRLEGGLGNDRLNGGVGADVLVGGQGDDTYVVDNLRDQVIELEGEGTDTVLSTISHTLAANVEQGELLGTAALNLTGNELVNELRGNGAANRLDGGAGADLMRGGDGNDIYVVDDSADQVIETNSAATQIDSVLASASFTLGNYVENLFLTGSAAIDGTGNSLANRITGNVAGNRLDGGAGADILTGGLGNDTYVVDNLKDVIVETSALASEIDSVEASVSWTLGANLENLTLTGSAALNGTGNALANRITGNRGDNLLNGGAGNDELSGGLGVDVLIGGLGADRLTGGEGADTFRFTALNELGKGAQRDVILDFNSAQGDLIDLSALDANLLTLLNNGFSFIGDSVFSAAGQLRFVDQVLYGNLNGDLGADFEIELAGVSSFTEANVLV